MRKKLTRTTKLLECKTRNSCTSDNLPGERDRAFLRLELLELAEDSLELARLAQARGLKQLLLPGHLLVLVFGHLYARA